MFPIVSFNDYLNNTLFKSHLLKHRSPKNFNFKTFEDNCVPTAIEIKVHILYEGHKNMTNLQTFFDVLNNFKQNLETIKF